MTDRLPRVTSKEVIRFLQSRGFLLARSSGSHLIFKDTHGCRVTVSAHAGEIIKPKTLRSILNEAGASVEELKAALGR